MKTSTVSLKTFNQMHQLPNSHPHSSMVVGNPQHLRQAGPPVAGMAKTTTRVATRVVGMGNQPTLG